ncbi:type II toxin-antitoxin system HicA family toxin [Candidatus Micrarchaeota archaeon]|nr:type II toxin-antitoxin system HicA family toxin [Candidatus Micrarchaeota archaeon]
MPKLPHPPARDVIRLLSRHGFEIVGRKGSHIRMKKGIGNDALIVVVPEHKEIAPGTLLNIIRRSGISKERFLEEL